LSEVEINLLEQKKAIEFIQPLFPYNCLVIHLAVAMPGNVSVFSKNSSSTAAGWISITSTLSAVLSNYLQQQHFNTHLPLKKSAILCSLGHCFNCFVPC